VLLTRDASIMVVALNASVSAAGTAPRVADPAQPLARVALTRLAQADGPYRDVMAHGAIVA